MKILDAIINETRLRTERAKMQIPLKEMKLLAGQPNDPFAFERALRGEELSFICEVKKASPSRGVIDVTFPYIRIAQEYESAGASALSVLTQPLYFMGDLNYLLEIRKIVKIPVLQKDFILDEYQIYQARSFGADAILLINTILDFDTVKRFINIAKELGMSALVEAHDEFEVDQSVRAGARIIGVNNRDLKTMKTCLEPSIRLRRMVSPEMVFVSESGIHTPQDIEILKKNRVDAVLIGEAFMTSRDKLQTMKYLRGGTLCQK